MFSIPTPVYQIAWQGPRASQTLRFSIVGDTYPIDSTHPLQAMCIRQLHTCMHTTAAALISMQINVDADAMCDGVCAL